MGLLSHFTVAVLLFAFSLLACLFMNRFFTSEARLQIGSIRDEQHDITAHGRLVYNPAKPQNNSSRGIHPERSQKCNISRGSECAMAPESRFDCGRDKLLSQSECENSGCCYAPLLDSAGPPWCFYPRVYPGYKMGPLIPTPRGQGATLTRASPSYLPKDISTLRLDDIQETADCFHLTVSIHPQTCDQDNTVKDNILILFCFIFMFEIVQQIYFIKARLS